MKAMILKKTGLMKDNPRPLEPVQWPAPKPGPGQVLLEVAACGVCHTELDEIEGRTPPSRFPMILGHQVVGRVEKTGPGADRFSPGDRVGVAWVFSACGTCGFCQRGLENLCSRFQATGRDAPGGYAEKMVVSQDFAYPIPEVFTDVQAAPLLCAGAIGLRSLRMAGIQNGDTLGLTGFGASAHLVLKLCQSQYPGSPVFVFARNPKEQEFARELGAAWAGDTADACPRPCQAIIDTTPAWKPVVEALKNLLPGGKLVVNAIRKEAGDTNYLTRLDYARDLWMEKQVQSVANVARKDVADFLELAARIPILPQVTTYPLGQANEALNDLKSGQGQGARVLIMET